VLAARWRDPACLRRSHQNSSPARTHPKLPRALSNDYIWASGTHEIIAKSIRPMRSVAASAGWIWPFLMLPVPVPGMSVIQQSFRDRDRVGLHGWSALRRLAFSSLRPQNAHRYSPCRRRLTLYLRLKRDGPIVCSAEKHTMPFSAPHRTYSTSSRGDKTHNYVYLYAGGKRKKVLTQCWFMVLSFYLRLFTQPDNCPFWK
jgi:hypothetical protein